jgi:hypothetical protein
MVKRQAQDMRRQSQRLENLPKVEMEEVEIIDVDMVDIDDLQNQHIENQQATDSSHQISDESGVIQAHTNSHRAQHHALLDLANLAVSLTEEAVATGSNNAQPTLATTRSFFDVVLNPGWSPVIDG